MLNFFNFRKINSLYLIVLIAVFSSNSYAEQQLSFEGKVTDLESNDLLYVENHQIILDDSGKYLSALVSYTDPEGKVFAEKTLDYSKSALMPDMTFYDQRSEEKTQVRFDKSNKQLVVSIKIKGKGKESKINLDEPLVVVDAGFDRLIESKWDVLREDKEIQFTFLAITRAQLINFEVVEIKANESSVFVELQPRNFFINMLVDPIALEYDLSEQRLTRFEGLTNIEKFEDGKRTEENYVARIDYSYQEIKPLKSDSSSLKKTKLLDEQK